MARTRTTLSPAQISKKRFKLLAVSAAIETFIGQPEEGFSMLIWGAPGAGKSTLMMRLLKEFSQLGKCYFNSAEMGIGVALNSLLTRNGICVDNSRITIGDRHTLEEMLTEITLKAPKFVFIDSLDCMKLSPEEFMELKRIFPKKSFVMITWGDGRNPSSRPSKAIEFLADVKTYVKDGVVFTRSRFGLTHPYVLLPDLAKNSGNTQVKNAYQGYTTEL